MWIVWAAIRRSAAEGLDAVHLLFDGEDLLAASGAFGLRERRLEQLDELQVVLQAERVQ